MKLLPLSSVQQNEQKTLNRDSVQHVSMKANVHLFEMKNKFEAAIELLQNIFPQIKEIVAVYVFGSVAREDYSLRHSDLDLFIILKKERNKRLEEKMTNMFVPIGLRCGVRIQIEYMGKTIKEEDHSLLRKMIEEGKPIYASGSFVIDGMQLGLRQFLLYSYSLKNNKKKSYFSKILHGRKSWYYAKGKKIVKEYRGIIDNRDIIEMGRGAIMVAKEKQKDILHLFQEFQVEFHLKKIVYA